MKSGLDGGFASAEGLAAAAVVCDAAAGGSETPEMGRDVRPGAAKADTGAGTGVGTGAAAKRATGEDT